MSEKTYDQGAYDLAAKFLSDFHFDTPAEREEAIDALASTLQETVENWLAATIELRLTNHRTEADQ